MCGRRQIWKASYLTWIPKDGLNFIKYMGLQYSSHSKQSSVASRYRYVQINYCHGYSISDKGNKGRLKNLQRSLAFILKT